MKKYKLSKIKKELLNILCEGGTQDLALNKNFKNMRIISVYNHLVKLSEIGLIIMKETEETINRPNGSYSVTTNIRYEVNFKGLWINFLNQKGKL